jgi:hypothetical protein
MQQQRRHALYPRRAPLPAQQQQLLLLLLLPRM